MTKQPHDNARQDDDALLEPFFAAARAPAPDDLPDALQARLLHDALAHMPAPRIARAARPVGFAGLMARLGNGISAFGRQSARVLGGAPGVAVVCSAGVAGVWIGLAVPETVSGVLGFGAPAATMLVNDGSVWAQAAQDLGEDEALLALLDSF